MTFRELKAGDTLYALNHANAELSKGRVLSVVPHKNSMDEMQHIPYGQSPELKVDIAVEMNGKTETYVCIENQERNFMGSMALLSSREAALKDASELQEQCKGIMDSYETCKENFSRCEQLRSELDPVAREKQQTEQRLSNMESSIDEMKSMIQQIANGMHNNN